jgi:serine/threonine protein kinase
VEDRTIIQLGSPGSVRPGVRLNGIYEIQTLIAQGGMGEVYKGFNIQTNDPVAIKLVLPELARNADAFSLFRREASTLHNLHHEAIVRYFVFSVDPELQRAYLAMEFVDGPSLSKTLQSGPLTLAEVAILRKRIGGALEAAHQAGIVHRDISSDNIILPGGDPRRAKIIDFGIARSQRPGEGTIIGGGFAGKYNYVSPEQLGLAGGEVTGKSDIYSFGLVLAEALRGRPIAMSGSQAEIIEKRRAVPDLSDLDASVRPLLQAMLQPLPKDRPENMAAVAAWGDASGTNGERRRGADHGGGEKRENDPAKPQAGSSMGRVAAILGVLILVGSLGGTAYVFRDAMPWSGASVAPPGPEPKKDANPVLPPPAPPVDPSVHNLPKLPPLPDAPVHTDVPPSDDSASVAAPPPIADNQTPPPHVPNADEIVHILDQAKQQKQENLASNAPTSGDVSTLLPKPSNVDISPKVDVPPKKVDTQDVPVAKPPPSLPPAPSAPRAPQGDLTLGDAAVGKDYVADLPPFSDSVGGKGLALHVEPGPPDGLTFADLGAGYSQISGKPTAPGRYSFRVVASNPAGASAHMTIRMAVAGGETAIVVAPGPQTQPPPPVAENQQVASVSPAQKALSFVRSFDGGPCFYARPQSSGPDAIAIQGIGADKAVFQRFYGDFIHEIGVEPTLNVRLIGAAECPAVDLIRASGLDRSDAPKIDLNAFDVGRGRPLAGTISNVGGRRVDLLFIGSDGQAHRVDTRLQAGGASAAFSAPIVPDAAAVEALQMLVAVASPRPVQALEGFTGGPAAAILPRLRDELPASGGALEVEFFKLVK